jgi:hypothetical protein
MSVIEHLFQRWKWHFNKAKCQMDDKVVRGTTQIRELALKVFNNNRKDLQGHVDRMIEGYDRRVAAVIAAKGGCTKY